MTSVEKNQKKKEIKSGELESFKVGVSGTQRRMRMENDADDDASVLMLY